MLDHAWYNRVMQQAGGNNAALLQLPKSPGSFLLADDKMSRMAASKPAGS